MTISIVCPNGHRLRVKEGLSGKSIKCPSCGSTIEVPALQRAPETESFKASAPTENFDLSAYIPAPAPTAIPIQAAPQTRESPQNPVPSKASSSKSQTRATLPPKALAGIDRRLLLFWFLGGCAGGSVLGALILLAVWLGSTGNNDRALIVAKNTSANDHQSSAKPLEPAPSSSSTAAASGASGVATPSPSKLAPISVDAESINEITNKLRRVGFAFHNFHDINKIFAFVNERDIEAVEPNRNPPPTKLSWRVHLLPYLEHKPLYDSFHLDEPWDSPHNLTLLNKMPEAYRIDSSDVTTTRFQVFTGQNALFGRSKPPRLRDVMDGLPHTILAVVVGSDRAVPWTKPDELTLDPTQPVASLGKLPDRLIKCVMADGSPLIIADDIEPADFFALATPNGKEIVDAEKLRRLFKERSTNNLAKQPNSQAPSTNADGSQAASMGSPIDLRIVMDGRMTKLKELVLAMHDYQSTYRQLPLSKNSASFDANGKPYLSWRVHLLPFLNQQTLYSQFKMGEPWDSPHNKVLIDKMPEVFRDATDKADSTKTRMVTITGPETLYTAFQGPKMHEIPDGTANTLLIAFCGLDKAVTWTQPEDVTFDPNNPMACLGQLAEPAIFYARVDGAVKVLQPNIPPDLFKAIVTPKGGEVLPDNFDSFLIR
jgi:Protein of unknown function (DUF1559)